ncbi:hypothetical protein Acr_05g0005660 [Actinidia rufa]|uniref:HXXXD-type acyl-transferase family protein n=1 Tax=Actinidia rufa TaxID=165716 RepID=A0A7J0EMW6_9ERIC|nr:hypothetical protein Acr_05g0005660 [Actinidia rufa]
MAAPNPVTVLELCKVAPTPPSPDSTVPTSLPITFFDTLLLRFCPTQRLFFYESPHSTTTFLEIVVPKLKHSLSLTLQHYLPLAGNVTWAPDYSKPIIDYVEGDAVSLTVAESEADFFTFSVAITSAIPNTSIIFYPTWSRLKPPIPPTYFGNCITSCNANANSDELTGDDGIAIAVKAIGEAIQGLKDGVLKGKEDLLSRAISIPPARLFSIAGSPRFEFYKTNFGWGRPRKVETTSIDKTGAFSLSDSRDGNSEIEIGIVLKKYESEAFESLFASGLEISSDP